MFLDYDGTLAPLTSHPSSTVMEPESEDALHKLALYPNVFMAIISGRGPQDVKTKVGIPNITYAGNHGLEIYYPNGSKFQYEVPNKIKANFSSLVKTLEDKVNNKIVELCIYILFIFLNLSHF